MNKLITLSELANDIAKLTQCTIEDAETFLREMFHLAAEKLADNHRIELPGIGTFVVTEETIAYAPDAKLASELNAPFSAFEAVELPDDYSEEDFSSEPATTINEDEQIAEAAEFEETEDASENTPEIAETPEKNEDEHDEPEDSTIPSTPNETKADQPTGSGWIWFGWAASCIFCLAFGWFARGFVPTTFEETEKSEITKLAELATEEADTTPEVNPPTDTIVAETPKPIAAKPIVDTIAPGRFLTTMAREHYGRMEYWVYIYEANASKLGNPDRLSAGTTVVIPSADSLNLRPDDPQKIAEAKQLAKEIYARFN